MLELTDLMKKQKSEDMYMQWKESVFDYIQKEICTEVERLDHKELARKKNEVNILDINLLLLKVSCTYILKYMFVFYKQVFQAFLDATNSKGALFLDGGAAGDGILK